MIDIFEQIREERRRQDELSASGEIPHTCASEECSNLYALSVLVEEVGEVADAIQVLEFSKSRSDEVKLEDELLQVAAVCVAWLQRLQKFI